MSTVVVDGTADTVVITVNRARAAALTAALGVIADLTQQEHVDSLYEALTTHGLDKRADNPETGFRTELWLNDSFDPDHPDDVRYVVRLHDASAPEASSDED